VASRLRFAPATGYHRTLNEGSPVTRSNILYLIVGALVIVAAVLGYQLYQDRKQPEGMQINLGPNGLSIKEK
jgi:hypothetical protein